jgi:hypothetical protein
MHNTFYTNWVAVCSENCMHGFGREACLGDKQSDSNYTAFGPEASNLRDPFEDHGAIRSQLIFYAQCFEMINVCFHNYRLMQVQLYLNPAIFGKRLLRKCLHIIIV